MTLSISSLAAGFLFSVIGFWLFREGKRRTNHATLMIGILLMVFSYFTATPLQDWGIGFSLCTAAYYFW